MGRLKVVARPLDSGFNNYHIEPTGMVIHYISARYSKPNDPYDLDAVVQILQEYNLAYHDLITRDGTVIELVPAPLRAWHAGESFWNGKSDCNSWMLGIALLGMHDDTYTDAQYEALAKRTAQHADEYPIEPYNIAGHENVAPERRCDPGPNFDWIRYRQDIGGLWPRGGLA